MHLGFVRQSVRPFFCLVCVLGLACGAYAAGTDRWTNLNSGFWRDGINWSSNVAPNSTFSLVLITNSATKTVLIDAATPAVNLGITSLTLSAPSGFTNLLQLTDLAANQPLHLDGSLNVNRGGALSLSNSTLSIGAIGDFNCLGGSATIWSGVIDCTGANRQRIGRYSTNVAAVLVNGGTFLGTDLQMGEDSGQGSLVISNGLASLTRSLLLGYNTLNSTGLVSVFGGELRITNDVSKVGARGFGKITIGGGTANLALLSVGDLPDATGSVVLSAGSLNVNPRTTNDVARIGNGGTGEFRISGGVARIGGEFILADNGGGLANGTGTILMTGGQLIATNDLTSIGKYGTGTMTVSNAVVLLTNVSVGRHDGAVGTLNIGSGAQIFLRDDLSIGRFTGAVGHVLQTDGLLSLTNDNIWVGRGGAGDFTLSGGSIQAEAAFVALSSVVTNPVTGLPETNLPAGTLTVTGGNLVLSSNLLVGTELLSTGQVSLVGGQISVARNDGQAYVSVASGTITVNGGVLVTDRLFLTNTSGQLVFNGGSVHAQNAVVSNGSPFVVGDGIHPATFQLLGGTYNFANGLTIASNATVSGCGTIIGTIINHGTLATNCPPTPPRITALSKIGNTATVYFTTLSGSNHLLEYKNALSDSDWIPLPPPILGNGNILSKTDSNAPQRSRFYRIHVQ